MRPAPHPPRGGPLGVGVLELSSGASRKRSRPPQESKAKNWVFTVNNPGDGAVLTPEEWPQAAFACWQLEEGESGTPHFQGFVQFLTKLSLSQVKALHGLERAHLEVMRGKAEQNVVYCTKETGRVSGPFRWGVMQTGQGTRTDVLAVKTAIDEGASRSDLYEEHFQTYSRIERFVNNYRAFIRPPRDSPPVVLLFIGLAGRGKTRSATIFANALGSVYFAPRPKGSGSYFDNYDGQDVFFVDEMSGAFCTPTFFNCLLDRYPMELPVHGGVGHQFTSSYIIITANLLPSMWWKNFNVAALMRRITVVFKFFPLVPKRRTVVFNTETQQFEHHWK